MARLAHAPGSTVGELMRGSELAPQSFTKHLDVLTAAGLIERVKDGRQRRVYPVARALDPALAWIEQQQRFWSPRLDALVRVAEAREQLQRKKDS